MLYLRNVTITGVDENTDINEMISLTKHFPFVEWGILISLSKSGSDRYPSKEWISKLFAAFTKAELDTANVSYHICGKLSRDLLLGKFDMASWLKCIADPITFGYAKRMQINVNVGIAEYDADKFASIVHKLSNRVDCIVQMNQSNARLWLDLVKRGQLVNVLFDASGGRGVSPRKLLPPISGLFCGYAGGINADNVGEFVSLLEEKWTDGVCWIDLESGVRDETNKLKLEKVRSVLAKTAPKTL